MWLISVLSIYLLVGMIYGFRHAANITSLLIKTAEEERALREMVSMYELSPKGAEFYTRLQELYFHKAELLAEYQFFAKNEDAYRFQSFIMGLLLWPYYTYSIHTNRRQLK